MSFYDWFFGCSHKHCSFPITVRGKLRRTEAASVTGTYVVCLECGKEFPYDWEEMRLVHSRPETSPRTAQVPVLPGPKAA